MAVVTTCPEDSTAMRRERGAAPRRAAGARLPGRLPGPPEAAPLVRAGVASLQRQAGNRAVAGLVLQRRGDIAKRRGKGYARYSSERLLDRLHQMRERGTLAVGGQPLQISEEDMFVLDSVAKVETGGGVNALNTWDDMIVSLGFKQVTLVHGSLYSVIRMAPQAFASHGIEIGQGEWTFQTRSGPTSQPRIAGVDDPQDLRAEPWASRFYEAGMDDAVVAAVVKYTLDDIGRFEKRVTTQSKGATSEWMKDPTARGWLVETYNNRPAYALVAARRTNARTAGVKLSRDEFLDILGEEIRAAYAAKKEEVKAEHILAKIPRDPKLATSASTATSTPTAGTGRSGPEGGDGAGAVARPAIGGAAARRLEAAVAEAVPAARGAGSLQGLVQLAGALLGNTLVQTVVAGGFRDENQLTNLAFWLRHPALFGTKLVPGQPGFAELSREWTALRSSVVRPALRAPRPAGDAGPAGAGRATPAGTTPAGTTAGGTTAGATTAGGTTAGGTASGRTTGAAATGTGGAGPVDPARAKYFSQDPGRYRHTDDKGVAQVWKYGSSGANTCNMTSVTMALVDMAGEAELRSRVVALLRQSGGLHVGAAVEIADPDTGKRAFVDLAEALGDPRKAERIYLVDLVTAAAIGSTRGYPSVTKWSVIAEIARRTGLARTSKELYGAPSLTTAKGRAYAKDLLARGDRAVAHTVNHFVFLLDVRDDGILVHDPAGARVQPDLSGKLFLHRGYAPGLAGEWRSFDDARRAAATRRVSENPRTSPLVGALAGLPLDKKPADKEWVAAVKALAKEYPGRYDTGERNFYPLADVETFGLELAIKISDR